MTIDYSTMLRAKFAAQVGSEQIALLISMQTLLKLLESRNPNKVLELGAGIGTLTQMCLEKSAAELTAVESNDWCIKRLEENLKGFREYLLISNYSLLNSGHSADFLIIDVNNGIYNVGNLISNSSNLNLIFIEGHHLAHRLNIAKTLHKSRRRQSFTDVREKRGKKGCAYFETQKDTSLLKWKSHLDFIVSFSPLKFAYLLVKFRSKVAYVLDRLEKIPGIVSLRKLWKGKIPWGY